MFSKVFLIGMMGAGKSSVGKKLSEMIDCDYIDMDTIINSSNLINNYSIEEFRKLEKHEISKIDLINKNIIISTGGGVVIESENRKIIKKYYSIYLEASIENLIYRVSKDSLYRPLIQSYKDSEVDKDIFKKIFTKRKLKYSTLADIIINTDNKKIDYISQIIKDHLIKNEIIN